LMMAEGKCSPNPSQGHNRNINGTLKEPLNEVQKCENIALHFPTLAEACFQEIARIQDSEVAQPPTPHPCPRPARASTRVLVPNPSQGHPSAQTQSQESSSERRLRLETQLQTDLERIQSEQKRDQRKELPKELSMELLEDLALLESEELEELIANTVEEVTLQVAVDSGSCANVAHPDDMPKGATIEPNLDDKHFSGAGGDRIKKYGTCKTKCTGTAGEFTTDWSCAEVTRALHSVSKIAGPEDHPTGYQDVLFNNKRCCVVPPGIVELIMSKVKAVAEYKRSGGLYLADITLSSFARQGPTR
jgi:hypothetical protein